MLKGRRSGWVEYPAGRVSLQVPLEDRLRELEFMAATLKSQLNRIEAEIEQLKEKKV